VCFVFNDVLLQKKNKDSTESRRNIHVCIDSTENFQIKVVTLQNMKKELYLL
jgi:hypothetical protein